MSKRGPQPTGTLVWTSEGWGVRVPVLIDGEPLKPVYPLGTTNKTIARRKKAKVVADILAGNLPTRAATAAPEVFKDAAERIIEQQAKDGLKTSKERLSRVRRFTFEQLGALPINEIGPAHIRGVLEGARDAGLGKQSVIHLRNDLGGVFADLWRDELIAENPVKRVTLPKGLKVDRRPRLVLLDDEFAAFMAAPDVAEHLHLMALASRSFGGMRTSDLHAWDWSHIDVDTWATAEVYRPKTDGAPGDSVLERLVIPEVLVGPLEAWWSRQGGKRRFGPVFPVRAGARAGERQTKRSHARELRAALWGAGIHRPLPGFQEAFAAIEPARRRVRQLEAKGEGRELYRAALQALSAAVDAAQALDALQAGTTRFRRLDFHSFRRAYNTALGAAGVNVQQAMALAGHKDPRTHMRYVELAQVGALEAPAAALPRLGNRTGKMSGSGDS